MKYMYRWDHKWGKSREQVNMTDKNGPSYKIPFWGSKFKQRFVTLYGEGGVTMDNEFVLESKAFESEIFKTLLADPENPYSIVAYNLMYIGGHMMSFDLKNGTHSPLYYCLYDPRIKDPNTNESCFAIDLETNHVVKIAPDNSATDTGLEVANDSSDYSYSDLLLCKNQDDKYLIFDFRDHREFKKFIDREFDSPCKIDIKEEYVLVSDGDNRYVFDKKGNQVGEFTLDQNIPL